MTPSRRGLIVAPQPVYEDRGTPIALRQVMQALSELGHEADVLTFPLGRSLSFPGIDWHRIPNPLGIRHVPVGFSFRKLALDVLLVRALVRRLAETDYAWVHAVEEAAFAAVLAARKRGVPVLYDMQSSIPQQLESHPLFRFGPIQNGLRRCEAWLLERADLVIASPGLASYVERVVPGAACCEWRFPSMAPFVDGDESARLRAELDLPADKPMVIYSGTFEPYQGLPTLIDAAAIVHDTEPDCRFVLLGGDPRTAAELERQAERLGLDGRMRFVPRQPRERVWAYLSLADVAVSPRAYGDNLPLKVLDYMALGMPIVATEIPAHTVALDRDCARLVPPTPGGLAEGILELLGHPARAAHLGAVARKRAQAGLGWDRFVALVDEAVTFLTSEEAGVPGRLASAAGG